LSQTPITFPNYLLIVLHHGQGSVAEGEEVDVMMFEGAI